MDNKQLLESMRRLGYPLLDATADIDPCETLAQVIASQKGRYWEGFPVLLANAAKEGKFDYARVEHCLKKSLRGNLKALTLLSLGLYDLNRFRFNWTKRLLSQMTGPEKDKVKHYKEALRHDHELTVGDRQIDPERLKASFRNYFTAETAEVLELCDKQTELSLESAMAQIFTPRQRELFNKKLKGELLTKTEREYFSRVIRKKALALANTDMHQLAQKVIAV